jgi:hypothetical protein
MRTLNLTGHSDFALNVTRPRRNLQKAAAHQESIEILEKRSVIQTIWLFPRACRRHRLLPCCQVARLAPFPLLLALPKRHYWQRSLEKPIHVSGRDRSKNLRPSVGNENRSSSSRRNFRPRSRARLLGG